MPELGTAEHPVQHPVGPFVSDAPFAPKIEAKNKGGLGCLQKWKTVMHIAQEDGVKERGREGSGQIHFSYPASMTGI